MVLLSFGLFPFNHGDNFYLSKTKLKKKNILSPSSFIKLSHFFLFIVQFLNKEDKRMFYFYWESPMCHYQG